MIRELKGLSRILEYTRRIVYYLSTQVLLEY